MDDERKNIAYRGVEVYDPFITTQVSGIHTITRRLDDERKTPLLVVLSHLEVLKRA